MDTKCRFLGKATPSLIIPRNTPTSAKVLMLFQNPNASEKAACWPSSAHVLLSSGDEQLRFPRQIASTRLRPSSIMQESYVIRFLFQHYGFQLTRPQTCHPARRSRIHSPVWEAMRGTDTPFDFNRIIPQPEDLFREPLGLDANPQPNWYHWNCDNWGTEWPHATPC